MNKKALSVCMIVKNENDKIEKLLLTVKKFADEIVIVDTGSVDGTKETAKRLADVFSEFEWINDFSAARNHAFSLAGGEYVMWLDADDEITPENVAKIKKLKDNLKADVYMAKYACGVDSFNNPSLTYYRERIIKNCEKARFCGRVHEAIVPFGIVEYADFCIIHSKKTKGLSRRNIEIYLYEKKRKENFSPRDLYYMGKEYFYLGEYYSAKITLKKFLKTNGSVQNKRDAYLTLYKCETELLKKRRLKKESDFAASANYLFEALKRFGPDGEILCLIGDYYRTSGKSGFAENFYKCALALEKPDDKHAFLYEKYYCYVPLMWLTVLCYDSGKIGDSLYYHKRCRELYPHDDAVIKNDEFFTAAGLLK